MSTDEQVILAEIRAQYESLSEESQAVVARGVSWIEAHWFWIAPGIFIGGVLLGRLS